jgi:dihydropteroate synthase
VGGESTRPGAAAVDAATEIARVIPIIAALQRTFPETLVSVDTVKADVARAALDAGAAIVNDVSGLRLDPDLAEVAAAAGAGLALMHSRGGVAEMAQYAQAGYGDDCVADVVAGAGSVGGGGAARRRACRCAIVLDPGLGFAKRTEHSLALLAGSNASAHWATR